MDSAQDRRLTWAFIIVAPALCAIAFAWPTLDAPFQPGDDYSLILGNPLVRDLSYGSARELASSIHSDLYQPLPMLSFQLNYALSGDRPFSYHLVNTALHAACAILAAALALRLTRDPLVACLTGVLFAIHPLAMDAVGWISGRITQFAALFALVLLNLVAWRRARPGAAWAGGTLLAGAAILASKVIPGVPMAAAWIDAWTQEPVITLRRRPAIWWIVMATLVVMTIAMAAISLNTARTAAMSEAAESAGVPGAVRVLLALRYYIENYFVPTRLTVWSPVPRDAGWSSPGVWIAVGETAGLVAIAWFTRRRVPIIAMGLGLFALLLLPFLAAVGVRNFLTADRYMYLPMVGLHVAVVSAIIFAWAATEGRRWLHAALRVALLPVVCAPMIIGRREATMRRDIVAVAQRAMELYPDDVRIPVKLSKIYNETGRPGEALASIADARRRWPDDPALAGEAGAAHRALGDWNAALPELQRAVAGQPDDLRARYHLALTLDDLNRPDEAHLEYQAITKTRTDYVPALTAHARNRHRSGDPTAALALFRRALETNPHHRSALLGSAKILQELGRPAEAELAIREVLAALPNDREALLEMQSVLWDQGLFSDVVDLWRNPTKVQPAKGEGAAWMNWAETIRALADPAYRPQTSNDPPSDNLVAVFSIAVRRGHLESPHHLEQLTRLRPPLSAAEAEELATIIHGLGSVASLHPREPVLIYATSVALALQGDAPLSQRVRDELYGIELPTDWAEPLAALDVMLVVRSLTTSAPTP